MHSVSNPTEEANELYIKQSKLSERLISINPPDQFQQEEQTNPLVIWDVGLGAATNVMAAIVCHEGVSNPRPMQLISFESDLDPLKLAIKNAECFPHLHHKAPKKLLEHGIWKSESGHIVWKLVLGDFAKSFSLEKIPDLIFYDPFSFKTDAPLWKADFFLKLFLYLQPSEKITRLYTYSASTAVRSALLHAGFWVGKGIGMGPKSETTIAYSKCPDSQIEKENLLSKDWLLRREKSYARYPLELALENRGEWDSKICRHSQFA